MDAQAFTSLLKKPFLLKDYSFTALQNLSQQYPYFPVINTLIAIKARQENDGSYEHYLSQAAIRIPDRRKLFDLMHTDYQNETKTSDEDDEKPKPVEREKPDWVERVIKISVSEESQPSLKKETEEKRGAPQQKQAFKLPGVDEVREVLNAIRQVETEHKEKQVEAEIERLETPKEQKQLSFSEWLCVLKQKGTSKDSTEPAVSEELRESTAKEIQLGQSASLSEQDEAQITEQAKASLSDDMEWVTETLAKVYEIQKKYDKAMDAYRMLSLKYPDKKAYFAERIEKLKQLKF